MGKMDRKNYGTREYTVKVSDSGLYVLVLNPEGIPARRIEVLEYATLEGAMAEGREVARRLNSMLR